jgi:hypothetical protein
MFMALRYDRGIYKCRIIAQGFGEAQTGTPEFWIQFRVLERTEPFNDSLDQLVRTIHLYITEKTFDRVMEDLRLLGYTGDSLEGVDPCQEGYCDFVGKEFEFFCIHEPDQNGELRERWSARQVGRPLDRDKLKELNRLFSKSKTVSMKSKAAAPTTSSNGDGVSEDDMPVRPAKRGT